MRFEEHGGDYRNGGYGRMGRAGGHSRGFGLRYWILSIVSKEPSTGAMIMDKIEGVSMGNWRPSPGHIYPLLERLLSDGYLSVDIRDGKKYYTVTEKGREVIEGNWFPWRTMGGINGFNGIEDAIGNIEVLSDYIMDNKEKIAGNAGLRSRLKAVMERLDKV